MKYFVVAAAFVICLAFPENVTAAFLPDVKGRLLTPEDGCGNSTVKQLKIVAGTVATPGAWPWMVHGMRHLPEKPGYIRKCGGSLITSRHVLTVAHCENIEYVFLGGGPRDEEYVTDRINVIHREEMLKDTNESRYDSDIQILYLERDVEFTEHIRPICLPINEPERSQKFIGQNPWMAGWGKTSKNGTGSNKLMQTTLTILENEACNNISRRRNDYEDPFSNAMICAGNMEVNGGTCTGDSGGPLMQPIRQNDGTFAYYLIGVLAFGHKNCSARGYPSGFVSTQFAIDWIVEMVNKPISVPIKDGKDDKHDSSVDVNDDEDDSDDDRDINYQNNSKFTNIFHDNNE